ncbi:hypothetical protein ACVJMZ_006568 [Sinorhizobium medicae]
MAEAGITPLQAPPTLQCLGYRHVETLSLASSGSGMNGDCEHELQRSSGDCQEFCAVGRFHQLKNRSPKMTANCVFASTPSPRRPFPLLGRDVKNEI